MHRREGDPSGAGDLAAAAGRVRRVDPDDVRQPRDPPKERLGLVPDLGVADPSMPRREDDLLAVAGAVGRGTVEQ
jgi:hypothetical protein